MKHFNQNSQPLCGKATWIQDSDSLHLKEGEVQCKECERLLRKATWAARSNESKERSWVYIIKAMLSVFINEVMELVENGEEIHAWRRYPKTEQLIQDRVSLANRPELHEFISILSSIVGNVSCKHSKVKEEAVSNGGKETCLDCGWDRYWHWEKDNKDDDDSMWGSPSHKSYGSWYSPKVDK